MMPAAVHKKTDTTPPAVAQDHDYLRAILDSIEEPVLVIDRARRVLDANAPAVALYDGRRQAVIGRLCHEVCHGLRRPCPDENGGCPLEEMFATGKKTRAIHRHRKRDGKPIWEEIVVSPLRGPNGKILGAIHESRDITELLKSREVINEMSAELKDLERLLPICAHCKRIRKEDGSWEQIESYVHAHSGADFTHGLCADCMEKHYSITPEQAAEALKPQK